MTIAAQNMALEPQNSGSLSLDLEEVRADFSILVQQVNGKPLVYLDNAATTQKPRTVIDAVTRYYETTNANIHRGIHRLSQHATDEYEAARETVRAFLNAGYASEIVFVRGATEGINLVAQTYGRVHVQAGDEVLITAMEHHSNIVPWQLLCQERSAKLRVAPISDQGELLMEPLPRLITPRTKIVAVAHVSNALGSVNPLHSLIEIAHSQNAVVVVDGAQAVPHLSVDVQALGCDFYTFSGHKIYGPTGIGVLYGKASLLDAMPPYQGGGDMISSVTFQKTTYNRVPHKFEAGTPDIAGVIGLAAAIRYMTQLGLGRIAMHERDLLAYATTAISGFSGIRVIGTAKDKVGVLSFVMEGVHPHDIGTILDQDGIAIRTGHHCAQPLMERLGVEATARASFGLYNTRTEIDALVQSLQKVREVFA